jgi:diamine N-acetyltransferase
MQHDIQIRLANTADAALIADMSRRTFYDSFSADNTKENMDLFIEKQFPYDKLMTEVGAPGNTFLLAYLGDQLAGYVLLCETAAPSALKGSRAIEIGRLYAEKEMIGKGVGHALMQHCLKTAAEMSKDCVWLGVWEHNQRAIAFYTRWGFEKFGEHIFVLGNDPQIDWWMKRKI